MPPSRIHMPPLVDLVVGARCPGCGAPSGGICRGCTRAILALPAARQATFVDRGVIGQLVRRAKRGDWRLGGRTLAALVLERERGWSGSGWGAVTFVPADRRRRAARGGHLPERFAAAVARELDVPAAALLRRGPGRPQRGLDRAARLRNVADAFEVDPRAVARLSARPRVLLLDDVRTTGATLEAAAAALRPWTSAVHAWAIVGVARAHAPARRGVDPGAMADSSGFEPPVPMYLIPANDRRQEPVIHARPP